MSWFGTTKQPEQPANTTQPVQSTPSSEKPDNIAVPANDSTFSKISTYASSIASAAKRAASKVVGFEYTDSEIKKMITYADETITKFKMFKMNEYKETKDWMKDSHTQLSYIIYNVINKRRNYLMNKTQNIAADKVEKNNEKIELLNKAELEMKNILGEIETVIRKNDPNAELISPDEAKNKEMSIVKYYTIERIESDKARENMKSMSSANGPVGPSGSSENLSNASSGIFSLLLAAMVGGKQTRKQKYRKNKTGKKSKKNKRANTRKSLK
jgi:hypothetical protein